MKEQWISVKDRLPDYDTYTLWCREDGFMFIAEIDHDCTWSIFKDIYERPAPFLDEHEVVAKITHWMPLPEPPKE